MTKLLNTFIILDEFNSSRCNFYGAIQFGVLSNWVENNKRYHKRKNFEIKRWTILLFVYEYTICKTSNRRTPVSGRTVCKIVFCKKKVNRNRLFNRIIYKRVIWLNKWFLLWLINHSILKYVFRTKIIL